MSTDTRTASLVRSESSQIELLSGALVALAALALVAGFAGISMALPVTTTVFGVDIATVIGGLLALVGLATVAVGVASAAGTLETEPSYTPGIVTGVTYGLLWSVVGGLFASETLGLSTVWPLVALVVFAGVTAGTVFTREDLAVTVPIGAFLLLTGGLVLSGVVAPGFSWSPSGLSATFTGVVAVPLFAIVGGLLAVWSSARAYGGFGARGRQNGAYALIGTNAAAMIVFLFLLVAFVVMKGFAPMTEGIKFGFYPDFYPWFHFYFPPIDKYVIVSGPKIWFYWPFVMEPYHSLGSLQSGVLPAIVGTVWLVVGAILLAVPLGIGAAVFLTEYAEQGRFTRLIEVSTNGLWSTPSIVYGLFGLAFFVPRFGNGNSILAGQLVLGFMLLPLVVITSRESLKAVPDEYRDASAALGVGKWETIKSVVVPAAMPGVVTGIILGVGRIAGETAPILLVTAGSPFPSEAPKVLSSFHFSLTPPFVTNPELLQAASALPYQLFAIISAGVGENVDFAWGTALVLLIVVLSFYAIGIVSRYYFRRKLHQ